MQLEIAKDALLSGVKSLLFDSSTFTLEFVPEELHTYAYEKVMEIINAVDPFSEIEFPQLTKEPYWLDANLFCLNLEGSLRVSTLRRTVQVGKPPLIRFVGYHTGLSWMKLGTDVACPVEWTPKAIDDAVIEDIKIIQGLDSATSNNEKFVVANDLISDNSFGVLEQDIKEKSKGKHEGAAEKRNPSGKRKIKL